MKTRNWLIGIGLVCLTACADTKSGDVSGRFDADEALAYCDAQVRRTLDELAQRDGGVDYTMMPRNIADSASHWYCSKVTKDEWCAGFWPGILWYDYEYTNDPAIRQEAEKFTASLEYLTYEPAYDHDLGFLMFCSYGNGYRLTRNESYRQAILRSAEALSALFNPKVGTMLSWPRNVAMFGGHNTIMDNMINLEMLFWAAKNGGDKKLYDMAVSHADTTMKYHFRPDYTSYHVAVYDTLTGEFVKGVTHQGYDDNSMWARGQAWAIYGYTVVYRETKEPRFLDFVQKVADVYLEHLPDDYVPYWDFNDPAIPYAPRDASAACVVASALLELSGYVSPEKGQEYKKAAVCMLESLSSDKYRSGKSKPAFLLHSTGNYPSHSEIDAAIIYADYYYIEALMRLKQMKQMKS
ncbi:glycosyl hydrolase family 88 [Phocaeicola salanitronis DSM 18170]|uniref:Glycosyl hydrolase family 88 n=1 Tax=Phocaeicola salanitronis (strain DSM 18170 / JCM 13657 / CCUG 60908 / BL78) TaxID=667015 RepID=F0R3Y8_PHOSB|nr:glycoside hydrolase family 88 protein [Phocaeicola salanitronis]ADY35563.1 glycosyl hydrolase family 88 [Phocaeicola salanitronis DSM 18170]